MAKRMAGPLPRCEPGAEIASAPYRRWTNLSRLHPLHIRRGRFLHQRGDRLVRRHHLLPVAAEPADRDRMALGFLLADNEEGRDLGQRVLADLVVDLLVAQVDLDAQARTP